MRTARKIVFRKITRSDFFNIYKAPGQETGGGGQSYIDIDTSGVSIALWHEFFHGVTPRQMKRGPAWDFQIGSLGFLGTQTLRIGQRRATSVSIRSQKLASRASERVRAWHPEHSGFPEPASPPKSASDPVIAPLVENLIIYIIRDEQSGYWAGWFRRGEPDAYWRSASPLRRMFSDNDGFILSAEGIPFDETDKVWPFRKAAGYAARLNSRTEEEIAQHLFEDDVGVDEAETREEIRRVRIRNTRAAKKLKYLYKKCQITDEEYLFPKADGTPYTEVHHLVPLGEGGADAPHNLIVVSAHVHRMLHFADVGPIDLSQIKDNNLQITINGEPYNITWHPDHRELIQSAAKDFSKKE